jgi:hypothetical protein
VRLVLTTFGYYFWSRLWTDLYSWSMHGRSPSGMSSGMPGSSPAPCKGAVWLLGCCLPWQGPVCGYGSGSDGGSRLVGFLCKCTQIQGQGPRVT